jgi:hypothetical protein
MPKLDSATHAVRRLVKKIWHEKADGFGPGWRGGVGASGIGWPNPRWMLLNAAQAKEFANVVARLDSDPRFEWATPKKLDAALWRVVCQARLHPNDLNVADAFIGEYMREPIEQTCYFRIEGLATDEEVDIFGVRLLPASAVAAPDHIKAFDAIDYASGRSPDGSIAAVPVVGTSDVRMADRGRALAEHALRLLRMTLKAHHELDDRGLRFKVSSTVWWMDGGGGRWSMPDRPTRALPLVPAFVSLAASQPVASLLPAGGTDIARHARIALSWFERSQLDDDPVAKMLYLFFALEAILGDRSEGLKAEKLALRRAILGHLTTGSFRHPSRAYSQYEQVRNEAVHGGQPQVVTEKEVVQFSADIREGINELLQLADSSGHRNRTELLRALDRDPARDELAARLYAEDPKLWSGLRPDSEPKPESVGN